MGVEHYLVCEQCKEYIDLHKRYEFSTLINSARPPVGNNDDLILNSYWCSRAIWFLWKHRGHTGVVMATDAEDSWFDREPYLREVFSHNDDLKLRKDAVN